MKVKVAVPLPAGTWGSERPHSDSLGSGPAPAAGGPPPGDRAGSAPPYPTPTPSTHPQLLTEVSWPRPRGHREEMASLCGSVG